MKKSIKKMLLWLFMAISLFSFSGCGQLLIGCGEMFIGCGQLMRIMTDDFREDYLKWYGLTEEDCLPIEEITSNESYRFNGCVYNRIDLDDSYQNGYNGRYYQWRGAGTYLDHGYGENGSSKIVGLKEGKIGYYVGSMTPFVYVSTYDENWDMLSYHLRDYVKEGVEIPLISEAKFTGASVEYSYYETSVTTFEQSIMLKDIIDFQTTYSGEGWQSTSFTLLLDVEGFPYLQSGNFALYERKGDLYIYRNKYYYRIQEEYQFLLKGIAMDAQEGMYDEKSE